jgi:aspartate 1-decarboxylase
MCSFALKSKLHLACVTGAELNYDGSLKIDAQLMVLEPILLVLAIESSSAPIKCY